MKLAPTLLWLGVLLYFMRRMSGSLPGGGGGGGPGGIFGIGKSKVRRK